MCVIDETIAFMGGLDLCYGRWDTSQHVLIDEDHTDPDGPNGPVWRGKDYSNERVVEFSNLDKPFEDSIDRKKVPRMPWYVFSLLPHLLYSFAPSRLHLFDSNRKNRANDRHDVGMQIVGQPARDICRHFVQRWNLLIRTKVSDIPFPRQSKVWRKREEILISEPQTSSTVLDPRYRLYRSRTPRSRSTRYLRGSDL
jgi:phospholipase D1/2